MIEGPNLTRVVKDITKNQSLKPIKYFMAKYGITYDEYKDLSYAVLACNEYKMKADRLAHRLGEMNNTVRRAAEVGKRLNESLRRDDLEYIFDTIIDACQKSMRKFAEGQLEEDDFID